MKPRHLLVLASLALAAGLLPQPNGLAAQARGAGAFETRTELQQRVSQIEDRLAGGDLESDRKQQLRQELQRIRQRLREGDFRPGDMVRINVPGSDTLSGTFQVGGDRALRIPAVGSLDLGGVLYAEADSVVARELGRYVRVPNDRIDAQPLKRIAVVGGVGSPGYYDVAPSVTVSDVVMRAGGVTTSSQLEKIQLRRDGRTVASAEEGGLQESMTLAELGTRRGDEIFVPQRGGGTGFGTIMSVVGALSTLTFAATRIF